MKYIWYEVRNIIISNYYIEHALLYKSYERANVRRISYSRVPGIVDQILIDNQHPLRFYKKK